MNEQANGLVGFLLARIAEREADIRNDIVGRRYNDPRFELAECEAKRQIVETCQVYEYEVTNAYGYDDVLQALAAVYADHPGYDESWRP